MNRRCSFLIVLGAFAWSGFGCTDAGAPAGPAGPSGSTDGGSRASGDSGGRPAARAIPDASFTPPAEDAGEPMVLPGGDLAGTLSGTVEINGDSRVPAGQTVTVAAGSWLRIASGVGITVTGTLMVQGTAERPVRIEGNPDFGGIRIEGTFDADFVQIQGASSCLDVQAGASLALADSDVRGCQVSLRTVNGAVLERSAIYGGQTIVVNGGTLRMVDSVVDLQHPQQAPDCVVLNGGGLDLEHSQVTGCHCPLHINRSDTPLSIVSSILDGAAYPVMIASSTGTFTRNHVLGGANHILDIGGGIAVDITGNYFDGAAPNLGTSVLDQFPGREAFLTEPIADVGPR